MTNNFSEEGKVKFTMFDYITNMMADLPMDMNGERGAICDFLRREDELMTELMNHKRSTS
jgi:hypothetical protein